MSGMGGGSDGGSVIVVSGVIRGVVKECWPPFEQKIYKIAIKLHLIECFKLTLFILYLIFEHRTPSSNNVLELV